MPFAGWRGNRLQTKRIKSLLGCDKHCSATASALTRQVQPLILQAGEMDAKNLLTVIHPSDADEKMGDAHADKLYPC